MEEVNITYLLSQLAYQSPLLIVYSAGAVLGLVFLRRFTAPALLCLLGCGLLLMTILVLTAIQAVLMQQQLDGGWSTVRYAQMISVVGIAGRVVNAVGFLLLIVGMFIGRSRADERVV